MGLVTPCHIDRILGDVSGADFNPQRYSLFNPIPAASTANIAIVDFNNKFSMVIICFPQLSGQTLSVGHYVFPVIGFSDDRQQHHMSRSNFRG